MNYASHFESVELASVVESEPKWSTGQYAKTARP
jgi:hypothetical protein